MDPITMLLLGGSALASVGGGILSRNDAMSNAQAEARARNQILSSKIGNLEGIYNNTNKPAFDSLMAGYSPGAQSAGLASSQDKRAGANAANVSADNASSIPISADAAPAVKAAYARKMQDAVDYATNYAKSQGKLGGYSDQWFNNNLNNQEAGRQIGFGNSLAEGQKSLIGPEQDAAAAASYKTPSIWGPALQGLGSLGAAYAGANMGRGGGTPSYFGGMGGPYV
jgi:hypothetical protein